ncbi:MAG: UDP-N-acetylmuramoyl-L-alanyl-D-glutamate--2,6-diaminopimelate ligase [Candidatus Comchoanobacterales bacterium]
MKQSLNTYLTDIWSINLETDVLFSRFVQDSRVANKGDVFLALKGSSEQHGSMFIESAIQRGVSAVLVSGDEHQHGFVSFWPTTRIPIVTIKSLEDYIGALANQYYHHPSASQPVVAVTGTNGKTSVCYMMCLLLNALGQKGGLIGTLGRGIPPKTLHQPFGLTTPSAIDVHESIHALKDKCALIAMEASSHALDQGRLNGVTIKGAVFTNLSHDHLDYHQNMANYLQAKLTLFRHEHLDFIVVNMDDDHAEDVIHATSPQVKIIGISMKSQPKHPRLTGYIWGQGQGNQCHVTSSWGAHTLTCLLIGEHNQLNLLSAIACLIQEGYEAQALFQASQKVDVVPGRMQCIQYNDAPLVVVDYAHTPDALSRVLQALKRETKGKLWVVFGCGGQRDVDKRHQMGRVAEQVADHVILTNDNPRYESPTKIIDQILSGMVCAWAVIIEPDRANAIAEALRQAKSGDTVLIAGKGHENIQEIRGSHHYFSDLEQAERFLALKVGS